VSEQDQAHYEGLRRMYLGAPLNQAHSDLDLVVSDGAAVVTVTATPSMHHAARAVHGSHYFKLLDDAAFFAANAMHPDVFVLTAQFSVQLMRPVVQGRLRAEGRVTKPGRRMTFAEATLYGPDGKVLAKGHGSFAVSELKLVDVPGYLAE